MFFLGRREDYPTAQEGSLKLKEISYIHSEAYPSGELKHGTLALMEKGVTAVMVSSCSDLVEKNSAAAKEVQCRGAEVVTVSPYGGVGEIVRIPSVQRYFGGVISVIPLQLLAYHTAVALGRGRRQAAQPRQVRHGGIAPLAKLFPLCYNIDN